MRFVKAIIVLLFFSAAVQAQQNQYYLFIGTYTSGKSEGIYVYRFNTKTGDATPVSVAKHVDNPSFLTVSPNGKYVYAVNENGSSKPNEVSAFAFNKTTGTLRFLNKQNSGGADPCHVSEDASGKWVFVANYTGGSLAAFPVNPDGSLHPYTQLIQHTGHSVNPQRQEKAHVHEVAISPDQHYLFTPDLGMDKVMIYKINPAAAEKPLKASTPPYVTIPPGNGPRHITFHPNHHFAYLITELSGMVTAYQYHQGQLKPVQTISSHPANFSGEKGSAEVQVSPDGKFLYASNRGDANNLCIFSINPQTGKLTVKGFQPVLGKTPRNFIIDPTGNYLLVANQNSDNIVIFKRNKTTGLLEDTGKQISIGNPVCLQLLPVQ